MHSRLSLLFAITVGVAIASPSALLAETVINFDDLSLGNFGDIPGDYQSRAAGTPNVEVSYRTFDVSNGATVADQLDFWNTGYGDLENVAFAVQNGRGAEIILTPDTGFAVTLSSFDLAGWPTNDLTAEFVRIVDANGNLLLDLGTNITILGSGPSHSAFAPNLTHAGTIRLQWGTDWNIGIDNIRFSQGAAQVIPEPGTMTIVLLGGVLLVSARPLIRRKPVV